MSRKEDGEEWRARIPEREREKIAALLEDRATLDEVFPHYWYLNNLKDYAADLTEPVMQRLLADPATVKRVILYSSALQDTVKMFSDYAEKFFQKLLLYFDDVVKCSASLVHTLAAFPNHFEEIIQRTGILTDRVKFKKLMITYTFSLAKDSVSEEYAGRLLQNSKILCDYTALKEFARHPLEILDLLIVFPKHREEIIQTSEILDKMKSGNVNCFVLQKVEDAWPELAEAMLKIILTNDRVFDAFEVSASQYANLLERFPKFKDTLIERMLNPKTLQKLIRRGYDFISIAEAIPERFDELIKQFFSVDIRSNEMTQHFHNLIDMLEKLPKHAKAIIMAVLKDPAYFNKWIRSDENLRAIQPYCVDIPPIKNATSLQNARVALKTYMLGKNKTATHAKLAATNRLGGFATTGNGLPIDVAYEIINAPQQKVDELQAYRESISAATAHTPDLKIDFASSITRPIPGTLFNKLDTERRYQRWSLEKACSRTMMMLSNNPDSFYKSVLCKESELQVIYDCFTTQTEFFGLRNVNNLIAEFVNSNKVEDCISALKMLQKRECADILMVSHMLCVEKYPGMFTTCAINLSLKEMSNHGNLRALLNIFSKLDKDALFQYANQLNVLSRDNELDQESFERINRDALKQIVIDERVATETNKQEVPISPRNSQGFFQSTSETETTQPTRTLENLKEIQSLPPQARQDNPSKKPC